MANGDPSQMPDEGGAPPGGPPGGAGGPPGLPGGGGPPGGGVLPGLQRAQQMPPTSPGSGDMGDALMKIKQAMLMMQEALPGLNGTQHYAQLAHMLSRLAKIVPAGAPTAGVQQTMHKDLGRANQRNWLLQQVAQNMAPNQQSPMPQTPLPGA